MSRKLVVFSVLGLAVLIGIYMTYISAPPHYYQSRVFFWLNKSALTKLARQFEADDQLEQVSFSGSGTVLAKYRGEEIPQPLDVGKNENYFPLMSKARVSPVLKFEEGMLFYIGAEHKSGKDYQISYVLLDESSFSTNPCDDNMETTAIGNCYIRIEDQWALHYEWVSD